MSERAWPLECLSHVRVLNVPHASPLDRRDAVLTEVRPSGAAGPWARFSRAGADAHPHAGWPEPGWTGWRAVCEPRNQ